MSYRDQQAMQSLPGPVRFDDVLSYAKKSYGFADYKANPSIPSSVMDRIMKAYGKTEMRSGVYGNGDEPSLTNMESPSYQSSGASFVKRGFDDALGMGSMDDDIFDPRYMRKKSGLTGTGAFATKCDCRSGSIQEHCTKCLRMTTAEFVQRGLSTADPTTMDLNGTLEQSNYNALMATIEHFTDAGVGEFYNELVPVINRPPDAALSVNIISTHFLPAAAMPIAPGAMPPIVNQATDIRHATMDLYAIAAKIPLNMFTSKRGCQIWVEMLLQMSKGFALTERYGAILAIAGIWRISQQRPGSSKRLMSIDEYYDGMARDWACLQHYNANSYPLLVSNLGNILFAQNATPGERVMVVPPDVQRVLTRENAISTRYDVSGPAGPATLLGENLSVCTIGGQTTYVVPIFRLPPDNLTHPLRHYVEIGEYVTSFDEIPIGGTYKPMSRDRLVYTSSGWEKVKFEDMIRELPFWDPNTGACKDVKAPKDDQSPVFPYRWSSDKKSLIPPATLLDVVSWSDSGVVADPAEFFAGVAKDREVVGSKSTTAVPSAVGEDKSAIYMAAYTKAKAEKADDGTAVTAAKKAVADMVGKIPADVGLIGFTRDNLISMHKSGIRVPIGIIYARPWKQYFTADAIYMVKGNAVYRLNRDGQALVVDNQDRTHSIIAERFQGTVVMYPQNVAFGRNVVVIGRHIGEDGSDGEGTKPIPIGDGFEPMQFNFGGASICIPTPYNWRSVPKNLNIIGSAKLTAMRFRSDGALDYATNGHPAAGLIDSIYDLSRSINRTQRVVDNMPGTEGLSNPPNLVCRMEPFWKCDETGHAREFVPGNGFWQPWGTYDDAHRARCGGVFEPRNEVKQVQIGSGR